MSVFLRMRSWRLLWLSPAVVMVSWLAARTLTLGASSEPSPSEPPAPTRTSPPAEIRDVALARMIGRFASVARAVAPPQR